LIVAEASLQDTGNGLAPVGDGWFVLNAKDALWRHREGRGERLPFEGTKTLFAQVGVSLYVLQPGEPIGMYHWEAGQEDFLVLAGEALLIVEGEERPLRHWDFAHCPPETKHIVVGAGDAPCVVLAVGARGYEKDGHWGGYSVDETALRHGAGFERETNDVDEAYARFTDPVSTRYRKGWLPGG
jgi:uncharacterized cupin superfamily protein